MQFSVVALFALVAVAVATPSPNSQQKPKLKSRQAINGGVPVNQPAMTDVNGNVIPFRTEDVYLDSVAKGL